MTIPREHAKSLFWVWGAVLGGSPEEQSWESWPPHTGTVPRGAITIGTCILYLLAVYLFISPSRGVSSTLPQIGCVCPPHSSVVA